MQKATTCVTLKRGKERPILQRHHWIYSGAIAELPEGDMAEVYAATGERLGLALLNPGHSIAGHMIAFGDETLEGALRKRLQEAFALRQKWFNPQITNAYRIINAEGDGVPGLIVDSYAGVLVIQISHHGLDKIRDLLVSLLVDIAAPRAIYEKSTSFLRKKEGMQEARLHLYGESAPEVEVLENGLRYSVDLAHGQKTGLFLDQRDMRALVRDLAKNRRVLNCFAYTGGFSVAALSGGALHVDSVESSAKCEAACAKNIQLNGLQQERHRFFAEDALQFLKKSDWNYDLVILDPPAFVKKRIDVSNAFRAYKEMNQQALAKMAPNTLLLTCSCSYHIEESLFQNILFRAADGAKRSVRILGRHRLAIDHPISIFHPESAYLKSFLLHVV